MPRRVLIQPVFSVLAALAFAGVSAGADSFAPVYDLDKLPGTGADAPDTLVVGQALNDNLGNRMTAADVNGDGTPDLIVAAVGRDAPPNVMNAGAVYIWLGKGAQAGIKHASGILGTAPDVSIYGGDADDALASSLAVGDVNGDGLADLVLGAAAADGAGNSKAAAGEVYIIFGRTTFPATLTMKTQGDAGANVTIYGATAQDQLSAGGLHLADFNADGVVDIVMGAPFADGPSESRPESGEAYVVAGRKLPATFPATIDLAVGGAASTVIFGGATADPVGDRITENGALAVGDINNDGAADIILGSNLADGPSEGRSAAGEIYIVPGRGLLLQVVDVLGGGAITVYGATAGDRLTSGGALLVADVNADGVDDVIAGAPFGDGPSDNREDAGEATVILGRQSLPNLLDLAQPVAITIYGPSAGDNLTLDRALAAGDINGDRVKDLVLGAMNADGPAEAANLAGEAYFVFGRTTLSSAVYTLDLAVQGAAGANVTVYGSAAASQLTGDALPGDPMLVIADFTGDAINDVLLPAPLANATHGEVYLVPGRQSFPTTLNLAVQGSAGAEVTFRANNAVNLGSRSLAAGDVNADGVADVLVSPTTTTSSNSGAGYVVFGTAPELSVEEPAGTAVADGDTRDLGSTLLTRSTTRTFTITNTGGGTLRNFKLTMIGSHANQFGITAQPTAPVAAGDSTTFTVRFAPTVAGIRTATLQIASSDLLHSPFDIHLTGTGVTMPIVKTTGITPGSITFDGATVNGTVEAKGTPWDVFFDYGTTTSYGSFVAAEPATASGTGITAVSKVLTGLLPHTRYNYRVRITHAVLGTVTGANMTFLTGNHAPTPVNDSYVVLPGAKVTLDVLANDFDVDGDSMSLLSFKAPLPAKSGTLVKSGNSLIFTASATFTGASFTYVVRDAFGGSAQGTVNLGLGTISLTPPGPMTFPSAGTAYDVDVVSNGAWSVTETLPWVSVDTLSGAGDDTITITLLPNPAKAARTGTVFIGGSAHVITQEGVKMPSISRGAVPPAIVSGTFTLPIETVNPPVIYTVKKMPPGLTISNTTGIINGKPTVPGSYLVSVQASNAAGKSNVLEFTIDVAGLEPELIGTFHGLIGRSGVMNGNVGSRLELVTTSKGTFTGKIITGTTSAAFKGALDSDPSDPDHPTINIPIKAASSIYLSLTLDATTNSLSGFHHIAMFVAAPVEGWRNVWSATNPASGYTNLHTFHLAQGDTDPALPQGYGFGSFKAAPKTGLISAAGKLADNSSFTTSTFIGPVGQVLLYQSLYTNKGSFFGKLTVTTGATADDTAITGAPSWFKPAPLPSSRDTIYRDGFGPFDLTAEGGTFIPPAKGNVIMGFDNVDNNAQLDFEQGSLTPAEEPDIVFSIRNTSPTATTNKAILPTFASGNNPFKVTMTTLNTGTGAFAGGFTIPGATVAKNRVATYSGMAVRVGGIYQGSGFFLAPKTPVGSETVATAPKSSGSVLLLKNP